MLVMIAGLSIYFATQLKFEEDISKIIPADEKTDKLNFVFNNSKFLEKLVVRISLRDSSISNPEELMTACDSLVSKIEAKNFKPDTFFKDVNYKIADDIILNIYGILFNNLPLFLEEEDYKHIDSTLTKTAIDVTMQKNYKALMSPSGFAFKENILKDPLHLVPIVLKKLQSLQFDENYVINNGYLTTKDGKNLMLFVIPNASNGNTGRNHELIKLMDASIDSLQKANPSISIEYFGGTAVSVANATQIKKDIILTTSIAIIGLFLFITFYFRSKSIFILIFIPISYGAIVSLAILFLLKGSVSAIALGIGSILLGIAINISLHIFTHFKSHGTPEAVLKDISTASILTALTTSSAFFCLCFLESDAMRDLGLFAGISIIVAAVSSLVILPHLLRWTESNVQENNSSLLDKVAAYPYHKNKLLLLFLSASIIIGCFNMNKVTFESDLNQMSYMSNKLKLAETNLDRISNYKWRNMFLVSSGKNLDDALENNQQALLKTKELMAKGLVKKFTNVHVLLLSKAEQKKRIAHWNGFWNTRSVDMLKELSTSAKSLGFNDRAFSPFTTMINKQYDYLPKEEELTLRKLLLDDYITETADLTTVVTLLKVKLEDKDKVYDAIKDQKNISLLDKQYLTKRFVEIMGKDFNFLLYISFVIVFLLILISFGRIELTLLCVLPMMCSWILTLGLMSILGIKFNIFNIIISTFIFGMGDDFSVFVVTGLQQKYAEGKDNLSSYKTSILLSTITTLVGIGVLIFAKHPALKSIALISIIGIFSVVLVSYTVQPLLFDFLAQHRKEKGKVPVTFLNACISFFAFAYYFVGCIVLTLIGIVTVAPFGKIKAVKYFYHWCICYYCRSLTYLMFIVKKVDTYPDRKYFQKPAVIICNHSSFVDILVVLGFYPKIIMLTNDWVYNRSPYSLVVRMAGFYHVEEGHEESEAKLKTQIADGYSVMVFPEGTRSEDPDKMLRFHKGAFYIAEKMQLDILPILLHGIGHFMTKGEFYLKNGSCHVKILARIEPTNEFFGKNYAERTPRIARYFKAEYEKLRQIVETPAYFNDRVIKNFAFKGPVLEWYVRIKLHLEKNYTLLNELIPREGKIYDIGCGYGYTALMLHLVDKNRTIIGIDFDEEKIAVAQNLPSTQGNIQFFVADVRAFDFQKADVFLISDVLHYLKFEEQTALLQKCMNQLSENGMILIRDADSDNEEKHVKSKWTERMSTFFGFNRASFEEMEFISGDFLKSFMKAKGFAMEQYKDSQKTSNTLFVAKRIKH